MIRVLIVDDSAIVRRVLSERLSRATDITVVGTAVDPYAARDKIASLRPDVLTLDLEMPRMGGLAFLSRLMKHHPMPVIVVSSLTPAGGETAMRALEAGAVDVIAKPGPGVSVGEVAQTLIHKIRAAASARCRPLPAPNERAPAAPRPAADGSPNADDKVVALGASTGGTEALKHVLVGLPADCPAILIVQHMPAGFTAAFADRLNELCLIQVREACDGDAVTRGVALVAPGGRHMIVRGGGTRPAVQIKDGPPVLYQKPSVDVLFHSVARHFGGRAVGVLLTGMGSDGARGLLAMRQAGARTLAQDEESCTVYGMPREAVEIGAAQRVVSLAEMPRAILSAPSRDRAPVALTTGCHGG